VGVSIADQTLPFQESATVWSTVEALHPDVDVQKSPTATHDVVLVHDTALML
jgi:hypothetical protein